MPIRIARAAHLVSEADLHRVERDLGIPLPKEFRQFMLESNGGKPESNVIVSPDGRGTVGVTMFFGIDLDTPNAHRTFKGAFLGPGWDYTPRDRESKGPGKGKKGDGKRIIGRSARA